jgi:hypothetical protein
LATQEDRKRTLSKNWWIPVTLLIIACAAATLGTAILVVPRLIEILKATPPIVPMPTKAVAQLGIPTLVTTSQVQIPSPRNPNPSSTPTFLQSIETPVVPSMKIIRQFNAPGHARCIAWDGKNLRVAEGQAQHETKFLKVDSVGNTQEVFNGNITMSL